MSIEKKELLIKEDLLTSVGQIIDKPEVAHRHSFFQLKYFILGKEPTIQARLRKCVTELGSRKESLENLHLAIEDLNDDVELLNIDIEEQSTTDVKKKRFSEIKIRKINRKKQSLRNELQKLKKRLNDTEEETKFFLQSYYELEKVESLKPLDDLDTNIQYWNEKYTEEIKLRFLLQKPIDLELAKCILALDKSTPIRKEFINILEQIEKQAQKALPNNK